MVMDEHATATPSASARLRRRRLLLVLLLALVAAASYYLLRGPRLHPVTRRLLPAGTSVWFAYRQGYPAAQLQPREIGVEEAFRWLDARGRPLPGKPLSYFEECVSPNLRVMAWVQAKPPQYRQYTMDIVGQGRRPVHLDPCPLPEDQYGMRQIAQLTDDGYFADGEGHFYRPDGKRLTFPADGRTYYVAATTLLDAGLLPVWGTARLGAAAGTEVFALYDLRQRRFTFACPLGGTTSAYPDVVARRGSRTLGLNTDTGQARIYEGNRLLGAFGTSKARWHYGEDGSCWQVSGRTLRVLHWAAGTPRVETLKPHASPDRRFQALSASGEECLPWPAVWGDGARVAVTETARLLPANLQGLAEPAARRLGHRRPLPREVRRLTLYRRGRRVGTFTVNLQRTLPVYAHLHYQVTPYHRPAYYEHLAFSRDGRYLSWTIDAGLGWQVYVFKV